MLEKNTMKPRAVVRESPNLTSEPKKITVHVFNAHLSAAGLTSYSLRPFLKLRYADQEWTSPKSPPGASPCWNHSHSFLYTGDNYLEVTLLHTLFFISSREIGRRTINFSEVPRGPVQWELISPDGEIAGVIWLKVEVDKRWVSMGGFTNHTSTYSLGEYSPSINKLLAERPCLSDREVDCKVEQVKQLKTIRHGLSQEEVRIKSQELCIEKWVAKNTNKTLEVTQNREILRKKTQEIAVKAKEIQEAREKHRKEKAEVEAEWAAVRSARDALEKEFAELKQEQLKAQLHCKLLNATETKLLKKLEQGKNSLKTLKVRPSSPSSKHSMMLKVI